MFAVKPTGEAGQLRRGDADASCGDPTDRRPRRRIVASALLIALIVGFGLAVWAQTAEIELEVPEYVLIGEPFSFTVKFRNTDPVTVGDGPFIDLFAEYKGEDCTTPLPLTPTDPGPCDGIEILGAELVLANPSSYPVPMENYPPPVEVIPLGVATSACPFGTCIPAGSFTTHPFSASPPYPLGLEGFQAVVLDLPFTGYSGGAIDAVVKVTARVHEYADHGEELRIYARGGFKNGSGSATVCGPVSAPVIPVVFTVSKSHSPIDCQCKCTHCADETVTGPNHPGTYTIDINVAGGQTIEDFVLLDMLPDAVQFSANNQPHLTVLGVPEAGWGYPSLSGPGGELVLEWDSIKGGFGPLPDVSVEYEFTVPEFDANGEPIVWNGCAPQDALNTIVAKGFWVPTDDRDDPSSVEVEADHELELKCLALQKQVNLLDDTNHLLTTPGDTLEYILSFQISDYTTFGDIVVEDFLSDGQTHLGGAMLHIEDPIIGPWDIPLDDYLELDPGPFTHGCPVYGGTCGGPPTATIAGGTHFIFHVYDAMLGAIGADELTGDPGASVPATGTITYRVSVDDVFEDYDWLKANGLFAPLSDPEVDKLDPLLNCARILAEQRRPTSAYVEDGTYTCAQVVGDTLMKSVYSVHRPAPDVDFGPYPQDFWSWPDDVFPGDWVTYRIRKAIPSCDAEHLAIQDWLSMEIFDVGGYAWAYDNTGPSAASPAPGSWKLGPTHTAPPPTGGYASILAVNSVENALTFDYGTIVDQGANQSCVIDILFTAEASGVPLPDRTTVVNVAQECESITYASGCSSGSCPGTGTTYCQMAIAQFTLREPELHITKGVVSANPFENPPVPGYGDFQPSVPGPVPFKLPCETGAGDPAFGTTITSAGLASHPVNSNLYDVDADDVVKFAIVVENLGGAPAFDVKIADEIPWTCFEEPACGFNLSVTDGTGDGFECYPLPQGTCSTAYLFALGTGIKLVNPGPTQIDAGAVDGYNDDSGRNIVVITYDLRLKDDLAIGQCCTDTAELVHYASVENGQNFVGQELADPSEEEDEAKVCIYPEARKCIIATSEAHTTPETGCTVDATIGEIVRYRLLISLPEEQYPSLEIEDYLDSGLAYIDDTARYMFLYDGTLTASDVTVNDPEVMPVGGCLATNLTPNLPIAPDPLQASPLRFEIGSVWNQDDDANTEYLVIEFNAIVKNVATNNDPGFLYNHCKVLVDGQSVGTSNTVVVTIVEPELVVTKSVEFEEDSVGCPLPMEPPTFTLTVTNTGHATAFDVFLKDLPTPVGMWYPPGLLDHSCTNPQIPGDLTDWPNSYGWLLPDMSPGDSITCTLRMKHDGPCCGLENSAQVTWSSLPGDHGTVSNPTESVAGAPGSPDGERTGDGSSVTNDYIADDSVWMCGEITGKKLGDDEDGDGVQDGLSGWTITATDAQGCTWTAITLADGSYSFCLPPGTYTVQEVMESGWTTWTGQPISYTVTIAAGQTQLPCDFDNDKCYCSVTMVHVSWPGQASPVAIKCNDNENLPIPLQSSTDTILITSDATCSPPQCLATHSWNISDSSGNTIATSTNAQIAFDPPGSGTYDVLLTYDCSGSQCPCAFQLTVSEGGCACGQWDSVTVSGSGYAGASVQPNGTIVVLDGSTLMVDADYSCAPPLCPVDVYDCKVSYSTGAWTIFTDASDPAQFGFVVSLSTAPIVVDITPKCAGQSCTPFSFNVVVATNKCGAWTDFDGDGSGDLRVEGRVVGCDGRIRLSTEEIEGPVTIRPTYDCEARVGPSFYTWTVRGPDGYARGSGDEPVRGPIEFEPRGSGTYIATITPHCAEQSCEACEVSIQIEQEEKLCECSRWGEIEVVDASSAGSGWQQALKCGEVVDLPSGVGRVRVTAGFDCVPMSTGCLPTYDWVVREAGTNDVNFLGTCGTDPCAFDFNMHPSGVDVTITPMCGSEECEPCAFTLRSEPTACECSRWGEIDVDGQVLTCGGQATLAAGLVTIEPDYHCFGEDCATRFIWKIEGPEGFHLLEGGEPIEFSPSLPGVYEVTLTPMCDGRTCPACVFRIVIEKAGLACTCGQWSDFDGDGLGDIRVEGRVIGCGGDIALTADGIDGPMTINPSYGCGPGCGPTFYAWTVSGPNGFYRSSGDGLIRGPIEFDPSVPGSYHVALTPYCNGQPCAPDCRVTVELGRPALADLAVIKTISIPESPRVGESFGVEVTVANRGDAHADRFVVDLVGDSRAESRIVPGLAIGASTTVVFLNWTCSGDAAQWTATADARREIEESNETNNTLAGQAVCHGTLPLPMQYRWEFATFESGGIKLVSRDMPESLQQELATVRAVDADRVSSTLPALAGFTLNLSGFSGTLTGVLPSGPASYKLTYELYTASRRAVGLLDVFIEVKGEAQCGTPDIDLSTGVARWEVLAPNTSRRVPVQSTLPNANWVQSPHRAAVWVDHDGTSAGRGWVPDPLGTYEYRVSFEIDAEACCGDCPLAFQYAADDRVQFFLDTPRGTHDLCTLLRGCCGAEEEAYGQLRTCSLNLCGLSAGSGTYTLRARVENLQTVTGLLIIGGVRCP